MSSLLSCFTVITQLVYLESVPSALTTPGPHPSCHKSCLICFIVTILCHSNDSSSITITLFALSISLLYSPYKSPSRSLFFFLPPYIPISSSSSLSPLLLPLVLLPPSIASFDIRRQSVARSVALLFTMPSNCHEDILKSTNHYFSKIRIMITMLDQRRSEMLLLS